MTEQEKDFKTVLFEGLGKASMCWAETPKGVFDSSSAEEIGNSIYDKFISDRYKFAIGFAEWLKINDDGQTPTEHLLDLYKQSLNR